MTQTEKEIINQFAYDNLITNLSKYELYYQISLEYLVQQTEFDKESALAKLEKMQLEVDPEHVFYSIIAITRSWKDFSTYKDKFDTELQKHASINALEDYVKNDPDLLHPEIFLDETIEKINNESFFNQKMKQFFDEEIDNILIRWQTIVPKDLAENIKSVALSMM